MSNNDRLAVSVVVQFPKTSIDGREDEGKNQLFSYDADPTHPASWLLTQVRPRFV